MGFKTVTTPNITSLRLVLLLGVSPVLTYPFHFA